MSSAKKGRKAGRESAAQRDPAIGTGNSKLEEVQRKADDVKGVMHKVTHMEMQCTALHVSSRIDAGCAVLALVLLIGGNGICLVLFFFFSFFPPSAQNIEMTLERGEKLEHMEEKAESLESHASMFQKNATKVKRMVRGKTRWRLALLALRSSLRLSSSSLSFPSLPFPSVLLCVSFSFQFFCQYIKMTLLIIAILAIIGLIIGLTVWQKNKN